MDRIVKLQKNEIKNLLLIDEPYLFVDAVDVVAGKSANGVRFFPKEEWFFKCHFLTDPVVPGVFQLEHIMQTAVIALLIQKIPEAGIIYGKAFKDIVFHSFVRPGEILHSETEIRCFKRGLGEAEGYAWVERNGKKIITSTAKFQMISPTLINKFVPKGVNNVKS